MDFTTRQQQDRRALALIEQSVKSLYNANAGGIDVRTTAQFRTLLEGIAELCRDEPHITDAISDTFHDWEVEDAEPDFWIEDDPCPRQTVTVEWMP